MISTTVTSTTSTTSTRIRNVANQPILINNINVTLTLNNKIVCLVCYLNQVQYEQMLKDIKSCGVEYKVNLINKVPREIYNYEQINDILSSFANSISPRKYDAWMPLNHIVQGLNGAVCRIGCKLDNHFFVEIPPQIKMLL